MDVLGARVVGPLEPYVGGFAEHLGRLGYTMTTRRQHMTLVAHLSRWLGREGLDAPALTVDVARRYIQERAAAGYRAFRSRRSLDPLLSYLRGVGAVPAEPPAVVSAVDAEVGRFRSYLLVERRLRPNVAEFYTASVRPFVSMVMPGDVVDAANLSARTVIAFVSGVSRSLAPKTVQGRVSALRALLRFWFLDGVVDADLSVAVPKVAHRSCRLTSADEVFGKNRASWLQENARAYSPITTASNPRPGSARAASSAAACGRCTRDSSRVQPTSKNSIRYEPVHSRLHLDPRSSRWLVVRLGVGTVKLLRCSTLPRSTNGWGRPGRQALDRCATASDDPCEHRTRLRRQTRGRSYAPDWLV